MSMQVAIQKTLNYIEDNLAFPLSLDELAQVAGYSKFHFCNSFTALVGLSVNAYITKRRLDHIIYHHQEGQALIDACLAFGYDTHAGFYKAFKRSHGCSPRKYLKLNTVKAPPAFDLSKEAIFMLNQTQLKTLLKSWPIHLQGDLTNATNVGGLVTSTTVWMIDSRYVLKTTENIEGLKKHIAMSKAIEDAGFNAATPLKTHDGQDYITEDSRAFVVMKQIPGKFLTPQERYSNKKSAYAQSYGIAIGELHQVLVDPDLTLELNAQHQYDVVMSWAMLQTQKLLDQYGYSLPQGFYDDYASNFKSLYDKLPTQAIHRDANPSNILFNKDDVSGFIDFDISVESVRIFDPCYCALAFYQKPLT